MEVAGKAVAVGWYEKPVSECAYIFLSYAALNLTPDYELFPFCGFSVVGCGGTELHDQFHQSVHLLCVSNAWQDAFTFFVNLTNRRSVWAAKHVTNYRKWGWMGLRSPSIFLFPNFMQNQLELGHSHLP